MQAYYTDAEQYDRGTTRVSFPLSQIGEHTRNILFVRGKSVDRYECYDRVLSFICVMHWQITCDIILVNMNHTHIH